MTVWTGQLGKYIRDRTAGTGEQWRATVAGQPGKDSRDRIAGTE
jgi:hypothetical protein